MKTRCNSRGFPIEKQKKQKKTQQYCIFTEQTEIDTSFLEKKTNWIKGKQFTFSSKKNPAIYFLLLLTNKLHMDLYNMYVIDNNTTTQ